MKERPAKGRDRRCESRCQASVSIAAPRLAAICSRVTGMYFVVPEVVPDESAK